MVTSDLGACEWFVWDLRRSGLIDRGQLDALVGEFLKRNPRAEAPALAEYLVEQGTSPPSRPNAFSTARARDSCSGRSCCSTPSVPAAWGRCTRPASKNDESKYAVKVLPRRSMWNVRLARRQVRSFSNFSHAAVVPFVDVGTAGGLHYLVWPLVDGSRSNACPAAGKLPANQAVLYGVQIAQGLTIAHQNNLFHGLLKPSNVMIGPDNQARILDFGIGSLLVENEGRIAGGYHVHGEHADERPGLRSPGIDHGADQPHAGRRSVQPRLHALLTASPAACLSPKDRPSRR